ncbi:hypothetical protein MVEN_00117000 [Mycena venus]|uniref:Uncharacterized protein n=1 Tax=Mycena venus TaxID=2733690 RepID=A0A8H6ZA51_9AGAR|nr:hypothetical protein MVEN_00117000 [Mycena venus]
MPPGFSVLTDPSFEMNEFDALRFKNKKNQVWKYLVDREQPCGPIHMTFRGKSLAITVGKHILVVHFGLEGFMHLLPRRDYEEIVSQCQPGPNSNRAKAKRLRTFPLPPRFTTPGSAESARTINILAAIEMDEHAIIVSDFRRLTRLHVISSTRIFDSSDLIVNSELWNTSLWSAFPSGPDWMKETVVALEYMDRWRTSVINSDNNTPIFDCLLETTGPAAGVGAHLANDILFFLAIHPDTPANVLCRDAIMYQSMRDFFPPFMAQWISDDFKKRCGGSANSSNPLDFSYTSDTNFIASRVHVFRKAEARVGADLYDRYQSLGLLDENHTIGDVYSKLWNHLPVSYKAVRVIHDGKKRYHVICAKTPSTWRQSKGYIPFADIASSGYQTTVGVVSFREVLSNKINLDESLQKLRPGRPKKVSFIS